MSGRVKRLMYLHGAVWFGARVGRACSPERRELADLVNQVNPDTKWSWRRRGHGDIQRMGRLALFINPGCSKTEEFRKYGVCMLTLQKFNRIQLYIYIYIQKKSQM